MWCGVEWWCVSVVLSICRCSSVGVAVAVLLGCFLGGFVSFPSSLLASMRAWRVAAAQPFISSSYRSPLPLALVQLLLFLFYTRIGSC